MSHVLLSPDDKTNESCLRNSPTFTQLQLVVEEGLFPDSKAWVLDHLLILSICYMPGIFLCSADIGVKTQSLSLTARAVMNRKLIKLCVLDVDKCDIKM